MGKRAIFVETPPEVDLAQAAFIYDMQYQHALRLIALPYEQFHQLADEIDGGDLILIDSTGRCGSTLISQALNTVEGVLSLSEPDIYTQIHIMRFVDRSRDAEYTRLLKSCTRIFGRGTPTLALKFRAMCIQVGDLLNAAFPEAKHLFLYRSADTWARSMGLETRALEERQTPMAEFPVYRRSMAPLTIPFAERHGREANAVEFYALAWLSLMERYVALHDQGIPYLALRYEDIQAQPKLVLAAIFEHCGLTAASVEDAYAVFSKDLQEGTAWSRASRQAQTVTPLTEAEAAQRRAIFAEHPLIQSPDFIAPGTLHLSEV